MIPHFNIKRDSSGRDVAACCKREGPDGIRTQKTNPHINNQEKETLPEVNSPSHAPEKQNRDSKKKKNGEKTKFLGEIFA